MTSITSKAVVINQHGGPEELKLVDVTVGEPGPGEIRIRHKAVGLNFIDVYQRCNLFFQCLRFLHTWCYKRQIVAQRG